LKAIGLAPFRLSAYELGESEFKVAPAGSLNRNTVMGIANEEYRHERHRWDYLYPQANSKSKSPRRARAFVQLCHFEKIPGAGEGIRTLDPDLGKVVLYH
jgi:hypothetical protein